MKTINYPSTLTSPRVPASAMMTIVTCLSWSAASALASCSSDAKTAANLDAAASGGAGGAAAGTAGTGVPGAFSKRVVVQNLAAPWEITWGPDQFLWVTERAGKRVVRIDPQTGAVAVALMIPEAQQSAGQDGVLGMALHPKLLGGNNFVYVAYTYDGASGGASGRRAKIVRVTFNPQTHTLGEPLDVLTNLPASSDHNSGRLLIGPDEKLYYTVGDQGNNQFDHKCSTVRSQDLPTAAEVAASDWAKYPGKILRINLDGTIPADNPLLGGARSHVFSYGHRNAQGLAFSPAGTLFATDQGPKSDDELNRISAGKNYGWPHVAGYQDDKAYVYGNWSAAAPTPCSQLQFSDYDLPPSVPQQKESQWTHPDFVPPLQTFYTVEAGYNFRDTACGGESFICWPTIAPSSLDFYDGETSGLSAWRNSLLVTSLKQGTVFRLAVGTDGMSVQGQPEALFKTTNRYRDLAVHPGGLIFYVVTDNQGMAAGPGGGATGSLENSGAVLEFTAGAPAP